MAYLLANKNWNKIENYEKLKEKYFQAREKLSDISELQNITFKMCDETKKWLKENKRGMIEKIEYSGTGNHENPSDIILHFKNSKSLGISLKVSEKSANIGFKNYSFRTISQHFSNYSLQNFIEESDKEILKKYNLLHMTQDERKKFIRSNEKLKECLSHYNEGRLLSCREFLFYHMSNMKNLNEYIFDRWFNLNESEYIKVSGKINTNDVVIEHYHANIDELMSSKITIEKNNCRDIKINKNNKSFFNIGMKNNSEMFCSTIQARGSML